MVAAFPRRFFLLTFLLFAAAAGGQRIVRGALRIEALGHGPLQPRPGQTVTVTARVYPPSSAEALRVQVQRVAPGRYVRRSDPDYETSWTELPEGAHRFDRATGVMTAEIAGENQRRRHLTRYRLSAKAGEAGARFWPALPSGASNGAWFTWDQPAPWKGASKPGRTAPREFSSEFFSTLPAYYLIAAQADVERSQWDPSFNRTSFLGTLVYEGRVYDHIQFHNRGQASTYVAGKNKWGFKMNAGDEFAARDEWGRKYRFGWDSFNLNACASPWAQVNRGMAGMDEALSYRAYQLAGMPSPDTFWVQFRVIDAEAEVGESQFEGDLWGLYLVVQDKNGTWLRERGLPDGNIFSAESGPKHLAPGQPKDGSDWRAFMAASQRRQTEAWWRSHFDLPNYYSFHALNRVLSNVDLRPDGNHYLYARPDGRWVVLPHDLDMMFLPKTHQPGYIVQTRCLELERFRIEYQNRGRELLDLLFSDAAPDGGQIGQLIAEKRAQLCPPGWSRTWPELDEAMWNWHPRNNHPGEFYVTPYRDSRGGGSWRRRLATPDFDGFCRYILEFCTDARGVKNYEMNDGNQVGYGFGVLWRECEDADIPRRPTVEWAEREAGADGSRTVRISPFVSPSGARLKAWEARVGLIRAAGDPGRAAGQPFRYEVELGWRREESSAPRDAEVLPKEAFAGLGRHRVRVRYQDDQGRWSHWSAPLGLREKGK